MVRELTKKVVCERQSERGNVSCNRSSQALFQERPHDDNCDYIPKSEIPGQLSAQRLVHLPRTMCTEVV